MAQNKIQRGEKLELTAPSGGVTNEQGILIGALFGVAQESAEEGAPFTSEIVGVYELPKATGFVMSEGEVGYWDTTLKKFVSDTTKEPVAICIEEAGSSATKVKVLLNPRGIDAAAANDRLDELDDSFKCMPAAGTQKTMSSNDTYVEHTEDALTFDANLIEARNVLNFEFVWKLDTMNAAGLTTYGVLLGALDLGTVALATGDANDYASLKGSLTFKSVGGSSTVDVVLEKTGSDGGTVTITKLITFAATGPATTSAVVLTPRSKTATGHASAKTTLHVGWAKLQKQAA